MSLVCFVQMWRHAAPHHLICNHPSQPASRTTAAFATVCQCVMVSSDSCVYTSMDESNALVLAPRWWNEDHSAIVWLLRYWQINHQRIDHEALFGLMFQRHRFQGSIGDILIRGWVDPQFPAGNPGKYWPNCTNQSDVGLRVNKISLQVLHV